MGSKCQQGALPGREARIDRLQRLRAMVEKHEGAFASAIAEDFGGRSRHETLVAEVFVVVAAAKHAMRQVGRMVAQAAAKNLTPVTLELGGKSPAIIDPSCDLACAAPRIALGKLLNAGQTCIAPDYALVPGDDVAAFATAMRAAMTAMYPRFVDNDDYTSIVNDGHYARLARLLADAQAKGARIVELGEKADAARRRLPPVLVLGATDDMQIMQEEIFGPLLPVVAYRGLEEAIDYVARRERHPRLPRRSGLSHLQQGQARVLPGAPQRHVPDAPALRTRFRTRGRPAAAPGVIVSG